MTSTKRKRNSKDILRVKTGCVEDFFATVKSVMRAADRKEPIKSRVKTLTFEDPLDMLHFLSKAKISLINRIRQQPDSRRTYQGKKCGA